MSEDTTAVAEALERIETQDAAIALCKQDPSVTATYEALGPNAAGDFAVRARYPGGRSEYVVAANGQVTVERFTDWPPDEWIGA